MSNRSPFIVLRVIGTLLLIVLVAAGGFMAYRAGVSQGVAQAPVVATAISQAAESGQVAPVPPMMYQYNYGFGPGFGPHMYGFHHFGFFPFGICGSILFLFLFFGLLKMVFFRGMWHRGHMHGPWSKHWENGVPSRFDEWHKRAHGEPAPSESDQPKTE